jgi:peroxiredoxin
VLFAYPMTGRPGVALPEGWNAIPGARGCTPQNCAFRDAHQAFAALGATVIGLSTQAADYQREMAERLHLPYPVLSDEAYALTDALGLPTFMVEGRRLLRRATLVIAKGRIAHVFYPVFPPDRATDAALDWLRANPIG